MSLRLEIVVLEKDPILIVSHTFTSQLKMA
jgi:hypothetical protein